MSHLSPVEVRAKNVAAMGTSLGEMYTDLCTELFWLHIVWKQFRALSKSEARIALINKAAGFFFFVLQHTLWDHVLLQISPLTDNKIVHYKETLTLRQLPDVIPDAALATAVNALIDQTITASKFARNARNRRIAHRELALAQSRSAEPLEPELAADVERVLALMRETVNAVEAHYFGNPMMFDYLSPPDDAEGLLYQLRLARMVLDARAARLSAGEFRAEDLQPPPEI